MTTLNPNLLIDVRDLEMHFPVTQGVIFQSRVGDIKAVDGVSFQIMRGETLGLVGESGSGKTTLGRCILQLLKPTGGQVRFRGQELTELSGKEMRSLRRELQVIFPGPLRIAEPADDGGVDCRRAVSHPQAREQGREKKKGGRAI